ncbi:MAG: right-handed parallel beta-helix repeat-containing protein, partial [Methanomassiliicoccaceae archaeon]|nr:right-handed parallel beta-helix repeat-containing protein [Methanomassiliicoccaceae archaeon]
VITGGTGIRNDNSSPTITNCAFTSTSPGAKNVYGIYNAASNPMIMDCTFSDIDSTYSGGALYNAASNPTIINCTFYNNKTDQSAGAMYNAGSNPMIIDCIFEDNTATYNGGAMYNYNGSNPTILNCTFNNNTAGQSGGAINNHGCSPTITNCTFSGNETLASSFSNTGGGAIYNYGSTLDNIYSNPIVTFCVFSGNISGSTHNGGGGGAVYNLFSQTAVYTGCVFTGNKATGNTGNTGGGAMCNQNGRVTIINCEFGWNEARNGGGVLDRSSTARLMGCTFIGNEAYSRGGGMCNLSCAPIVVNCTFLSNTAPAGGVGGMYNGIVNLPTDSIGSFPKIVNCLFALNGSNTLGDNINRSVDGTLGPQPSYTYTSTIVGTTWYDSAGVDHATAQTPVAADFDMGNGMLESTATYAIKQGSLSSYGTEIAPMLASLDDAYNIGIISHLGMLDMKGDYVVSATNDIDVGALRYIDVGEEADKFIEPTPPAPLVYAYSKGMPYTSGELTNAPVDIYAFMGDISGIEGYPLLPMNYVEGLTVRVDDGGGYFDYLGPINETDREIYDFCCESATGVTSAVVRMDVIVDMVAPTVTSVSPSGTGVAVATNTIVITFDKVMDSVIRGTVTCNNGVTLDFSHWSGGVAVVTYDITSGDLSPGTTFTVTISGFIDTAGNEMVETTRTFTTKSVLAETDFDFTPKTETYDSTQKSVTVAPEPGVANYGALTVYYDGSTTAPTDAGDYTITIDAAGGTDYEAITGLSLGTFHIDPAPITVEPHSGQSKLRGTPDPTLTYGVSMPLYGTDDFTGNLGRAPGESAGFYEIDLGDLSAGSNYDLIIVPNIDFEIIHVPGKTYYITATASNGASVSPEGVTEVTAKKNITISFSAASVTVDGIPLSQSDVAKGYYTFQYVISNHTVSVSGAPAPTPPVNLVINQKGSGHAEYSVNGSAFTKYTSSVSVGSGSYVVLKAVAGDGGEFKEWKSGGMVYTDAEISFSDVRSTLTLDLTFTGDDGGIPMWIIIAIILLIILIILIAVLWSRKSKP